MKEKLNKIKKRQFGKLVCLLFILVAFMSKAQNSNALQSIGKDASLSQEVKEQLKSKWINENANEYTQMGGQIPATNHKANVVGVGKSPEVANPKREVVTVILAQYPSYPTYINTGNEKTDEVNYRTKKDKWIAENPELYKELTSDKPVNYINNK